ncbi:hypothetical protein YTPLAS73_10110 [Nitrosarchaeum sp.]|nr:hypothetical protein YTPLAS73_10110 [Nitrosarchaeum sp.]
MKTEIKTALIMIALIVGIGGVISIFLQQIETESLEQGIIQSDVVNLANIKSSLKQVPKLDGISGYINTTPEELQEMIQDKVVLYDIWTYTCINCIRTIPYINAWNEKYADDGLQIIGVHSPEFEFEKDITNVQLAVEKYDIQYPVILDNDKKIWDAFENRYWPRKYLADNEGYIRYDHIGEGAYEETEKSIQKLLKERAIALEISMVSAESVVDLEEFEHTRFRTPELYFGYELASGRNQLGNPQGFEPGNEVRYTIPENLRQNYFYLEGTWLSLKDGMKLVSDSGVIKVPYFAKEVNIVGANDAILTILVDGKPITADLAGRDVTPDGKVYVKNSDLYNIIDSDEADSHTLEIHVSDFGFEAYTFTFG